MKLAITGATGFLGSHLVPRLLAAGHEVRALVRTDSASLQGLGIERCLGDVTEAESCARLLADREVLIHLAGLVSREAAEGPLMYRLHVEGTRTLLTAAAEARVDRVILASTSGTIAVSRTDRVGTEADDYPLVTVARWPYYLSKIYQEKVAFELCAKAKLPLICLNPSLLLGPGDARFSSVGDVWKFMNRDIPAMPHGGLSFVDVRDVAETFELSIERGRDGERYLLGAANMPFSDFFARLSRLTDIPGPRLHLPSLLNVWGAEGLERFAKWRGVEPRLDRASVEMGECFFYLDAAKAIDELGFSPRDPQETLRDTVRDLEARRRARVDGRLPSIVVAREDSLGTERGWASGRGREGGFGLRKRP